MITVMTFNIRYGQADDGPQRWEVRRELVIERIRAAAPDLLGLQAVSYTHLDVYKRQRSGAGRAAV